MSQPTPLCAEELPVGHVIDLGSHSVSRKEIIDFARHWDPQPFHIDEAEAALGRFGEVIASGVHTLAIFQRLAVLGAYRHWDIIAGRAIRDIQLTSPVRPGMLLTATIMIEHVEMTHPDRALVTKRGAIANDALPLMSVTLDAYVRRRQPT